MEVIIVNIRSFLLKKAGLVMIVIGVIAVSISLTLALAELIDLILG
jgi:hypothetical protein